MHRDSVVTSSPVYTNEAKSKKIVGTNLIARGEVEELDLLGDNPGLYKDSVKKRRVVEN